MNIYVNIMYVCVVYSVCMYRYMYYVFSVQNVLQNVCLSFFNLQEVGLALGVRVCSIYK
jgi:hypothetical protein